MRGDFSRDTRERARRSSTRAVLLQQGRQLLDADWNEQAGLEADREEQLARHVIGRQGAPRDDAGFAISGLANDLTIGPGSLYAEGLHLANPAATTYASQLPAGMLPALSTIVPDGQEGFVYVEAVLRPASLTADPLLAEPALAGADTVVREIVAWTVRVAPLATIGMPRAQLIEALDRNQPVTIAPWALTTGGLDVDVQTEAEATDPSPCEMPPSAGYLDQLNRLYCVEIRTAGAEGAATFVWTEDAGREAGLRVEGAGFAIDLPIARAAEWFPASSVVEVIDDQRMHAGIPGEIGTITSAPGAALVISGVPAASLSTGVRVRRWASLPVTVPAAAAWVALSKGIKIRFAAGHYAAGSAWTAAARTLPGDVLWPPYPVPDFHQNVGSTSVPFYHPTEGRKRYAALGIVRRSGPSFTTSHDLRDLFPPLTDITAGDVRFDDSNSNLGATDVQEAIDALAGRDSTCCTYEVRPGANWHSLFANIPAGAHATICFPVGNFQLGAPLEISGLGHVRLRGAGQGTKIWCYGDTCALRFSDCASIEITDMLVAAERQAPPASVSPDLRWTRGAVETRDCGLVRVERATLIAAGTRWRQAACLRVEAPVDRSVAGGGTVVVEDCDIVPGDLASGILVLNGSNVRICGNRIRPRAEHRDRTYRRWAGDPVVAAAMGRILFSHAADSVKQVTPATRRDTGLFAAGEGSYPAGSISYYAWTVVPPADWRRFHRQHATEFARGDTRLIKLDIKRIVSNLWTPDGAITVGGTRFNGFVPAVDIVKQTLAPIIDTAIVVAGAAADNVTVNGNSIEGAISGIRVALSNGQPRIRLRVDTLWITDNLIRLRAAPVDLVRNGIVVGNVERCWVANNDVAYETADERNQGGRMQRVRLERLDRVHAEGIQVFGSLGPVVHFRGNSVRSCAVGLRLRAFAGTDDSSKQWLAQGNYTRNCPDPYRLDSRCNEVDNV